MNTTDIARILEHQAERMLDLAKRIDDTGRPLDQHERDLMRTALFGILKEATDSIRFSFLNGQQEPNKHDMDEILTLFHA